MNGQCKLLLVIITIMACGYAQNSVFPGCLQQIPSLNTDWINPKCDHTTDVCECVENSNKMKVCYFCLELQEHHTFTRYFIEDNQIEIPGFGGRVWYFGDNGELAEYPLEYPTFATEQPTRTSGNTCVNNPKCTDAFTVDGSSFRSLIAVNHRFPAPTLIVPFNYTTIVDVYNKLDSESTSIHWHGMHQRNTPWMDGVEHITQCGIPPASSFRYIFRARPSGTHWYHSHSGAQRTDGVFGALIVKESTMEMDSATSRYGNFIDKPGEHTLTLLDWQKKNSLDLFTQLHGGIRFFDEDKVPIASPTVPSRNDPRVPRTCSADGTEVGPVNFWSGLINGRGKHKIADYDRTLLSVFTISTSNNNNRPYRFRLIGAQSLFAFRFSIDGHRLRLIATDGHFVQPPQDQDDDFLIVDFIIVHSGERYDFLLEPPANREKTNYPIRAETLELSGSNPVNCRDNQYLSQVHHSENMAIAILHYSNDGEDMPRNTEYQTIFENSISKALECANNQNAVQKCRAVNCPFRDYPSQYGITCTHIHELSLLIPLDEDDQPNYLQGNNNQNTFFFNFGFEGDGQTSSINGRNFLFPPEPLQLANTEAKIWICDTSSENEVCDRANKLVTPECLCTHVRNIGGGQTYRFVFTAVGPRGGNRENWNFAHPVHLHGHSFHVTEIGFGEYSESGQVMRSSDNVYCGRRVCINPSWSIVNGISRDPDRGKTGPIPFNAPLKDTVLIPAGGYAVVYFKSNNPGYWFLHCHIESHQLEGMAVVINESPGQHNAPPPGMGQCGSFTWGPDLFEQKESSPATQAPPTDYYNMRIRDWPVATGFAGAEGVVIFGAAVIGVVVCLCAICFNCKCTCNNK